MAKALQLTDAVFARLSDVAAAEGVSPQEWIARVTGAARESVSPKADSPKADTPKADSPKADSPEPVSPKALQERLSLEFIQAAAEMAANRSMTVDAFLLEWWHTHERGPRPEATATDRDYFRRRFCGTVNGGDPQAADADRIDADLAGAYGHPQETEIC